jgi:hypothetical protein
LQCANNLKQIAIGLQAYAQAHDYTFPAGTVPSAEPHDQRLSWAVEVLPFVEQEPLFRQIDRAAAWNAEVNLPLVAPPLTLFQCPDWLREQAPVTGNHTPYVGVAGLGADAPLLPGTDRRAGIFGYDRRTALADLTDGPSYTLLILETTREVGPWARGGPATVRGLVTTDNPYLGTGRPWGGTHFAENTVLSRGSSIGCNAALADGSVRFLAESVSPRVLEALATTAGGEVVGLDW